MEEILDQMQQAFESGDLEKASQIALVAIAKSLDNINSHLYDISNDIDLIRASNQLRSN